MFERFEFYQRRCVRTVIDVVGQVPGRWLARPPVPLDETSVGLLLLWSWLRWETDFLLRCLEEMQVDIGALTRQVDALLAERTIPKDSPEASAWASGDLHAMGVMHDLTGSWLDRAAEEAAFLNQEYLGMEHLLLAFLRIQDAPIAILFSLFGIDHSRLKNAVLEAIERHRSGKDILADIKAINEQSAAEWQIRPSRPAVGMPKRFSMAIMMSWVTLFAFVFSLLQWLGTPPEIFGIIAVMMFLVGIGQMWLFGGKFPRAASVWTGAVALSVEVFILNVATGYFSTSNSSIFVRIVESIFGIIICVPLGAFFGYLLGGLTAGIVLLLNYLEKRKADRELAEADEEGSEANAAD